MADIRIGGGSLWVKINAGGTKTKIEFPGVKVPKKKKVKGKVRARGQKYQEVGRKKEWFHARW